jgi:hypothetical protein
MRKRHLTKREKREQQAGKTVAMTLFIASRVLRKHFGFTDAMVDDLLSKYGEVGSEIITGDFPEAEFETFLIELIKINKVVFNE